MFETLAKVMSPSDTLKLTCEACGHRAEWTRRDAFALYGPDATPYVVRRRSQCRQCGERARIAVTI
jgi:rRNA maturation protein Nop10